MLAHERAHLSGRHHLMLRLAAALERTFLGVRFFAVAAEQVAYLVEVAADDAAARRAPRLTVAAALLAVAAAGVPAGTLGAGGSAVARRIERLIDPPLRSSGGAAGRHLRRAGHGDRLGRHRVRAGTLDDHPLPRGTFFLVTPAGQRIVTAAPGTKVSTPRG